MFPRLMELKDSRLDMLLVDDNAIDAMFFRRGVKKSRLNILLQTVTAGQEAIDYLEAKGPFADRSRYPLPDVIVLDLRMPQVNGFDFLAWRKVSPFFSTIPVVVFSGAGDPEEVRQVCELGASKHIVKPSESDEWEKVVKDIWDFTITGTSFLRNPKDASGQAGQRAA